MKMRKPEPSEPKIFTYQDRLVDDGSLFAKLDACAELLGRVERTLYAESVARDVAPAKLKNEFLVRFGITARHFNAIKIGLDGKLSSIKERRNGLIDEARTRLKKAQLETVNPAYARMLSALAYRDFDTMLRAAAFRAGIEVIAVNPAYTSTIGAVNHAARLGISVHLAAALAIARRGLGLSERVLAGKRSLWSPTNAEKKGSRWSPNK